MSHDYQEISPQAMDRAALEQEVAALRSALASQRAERNGLDGAFLRLEMDARGTVLGCNAAFAQAMGFDDAGLAGQAESAALVPSHVRESDAYARLWERVRSGQPVSGRFERIGGDGEPRDLQGVYVPLGDAHGNVERVIVYASDVTSDANAHRRREAERAAVNHAFAIINFTPDGTILGANPAFCEAMGYSNSEIKGRHHSIFVRPEERESPEYRRFWPDLAAGKARPGDVCRVRKDGSLIWLKAVYAPAPGRTGKIESIVKYASDVSEQVELRQTIEVLVTEARQVMRALAGGDLGERMRGSYAGELAELADDINTTCDRLADMTRQIGAASEQITLHAETVTQGNRTLAQRSEEQASFLEQTSANMEEMTGTVRQNADNAKHADRLADEARASATNGGDVVDRAVAAMREINASSRQISDIIGVIDEIAFQTNLLALNAAVEAARAGEQGRGFAVVASEVRNLAQRSASAAKDIKALIQDSLRKVNEGSDLVDESGERLREIVEAVRKVSDLIGDIATASDEQSAGIEQISRSVAHMDQMTQQNASLTEEAMAASDAARQQAEDLKALVGFFRLAGKDEGRTTAAGDPPVPDRRGPGRPWADRAVSSARQGGVADAASTPPRPAAGDAWQAF